MLTLPEGRPEHVEGASAQQPLADSMFGNFQTYLKTKQAVGTGCELFAQAGLAGCLASWGSTQPRCVNPPHIPAVLTHAVLTHPGCSQGTWIREQCRGCRPPAGDSRLAPFRCVKSKLLLFDIKYDCKGQQVEQATKPDHHSGTSETHQVEGKS